MAEGVLASSIIKEVLAKIGLAIWAELALLWSFRDDLKAMERDLATILDVLFDAEKRDGGSDRDRAVRDWLRRLKDVAHDIDDFLDECQTDLSVSRQQRENNTCGIATNLCFVRSLTMAHRLRSLRRKLDTVVAGRDRLGLIPWIYPPALPPAPPSQETISMVDESKTVGRTADKEKLMRLVLDAASDEDVSVIPIVGFGGLGKTTLAQLVFNDLRASDEVFDPRIWVSMSVGSSIRTLVKPIVSATKEKCDIDNLDAVANLLSRTFTGKKYLLVLDDVWSESQDEWDKLRMLLKDGKRGSKIIVTTRSKKVAMMVRTVPPFVLKGLSDDDCWELFRCRAFEEGEEALHPKLVNMGREIVQKCGGVPLAAKALGSMLRFNRSEQSWGAVKDSAIWQMQKEKTILPSLKLSYDQMPPNLKQCFAYCSVFPKNHEFDRDKLIQQWIALGFVEPAEHANQSLFDTANDYFEHLLWMSFLQEVEELDLSKKELEEDGNVKYKIHHLVHDLAQSVAGDEVQARNFSQDNSHSETLDLSWNIGLEELPVSIGNLRNLKILVLFQCWSLCRSHKKDLATDAKRANLRIKRKLSSLTLSWTGSCFCEDATSVETFLEVLEPPENLEVLEIDGYRGTKFPSWMMEGMELLLPNLVSLILSNIHDCNYLPPLGHLPYLQSLQFHHITGVRSMGSDDIPVKRNKSTLYQSLKELHFEDMPNLTIWPTSSAMDHKDNKSELFMFPVLKTVTVTDCPKLRPLPCLPDAIADLSVSNSSQMLSSTSGMISRPSSSVPASLLRRLWIKSCHVSSDEWTLLQYRPKLEDLVIEYCRMLHVLPVAIRYLGNLRSLKILDCTELEALPEWLGELVTLESLEISFCPKLVSLPKGLQRLTILKELTITGCSSVLSDRMRLRAANRPHTPVPKAVPVTPWLPERQEPSVRAFLLRAPKDDAADEPPGRQPDTYLSVVT
nr:unnamed protein product [Digitaria exilis]